VAIIGFGAHTQRPQAVALATRTAEWLVAMGHEVRTLTVARGDGSPPSSLPPRGDGLAPDALTEELRDLDLVVSLGGDGTMLRTIGLVSASGVPVLGVNFGNLGYLTVIEPEELTDSLKRFLAGDYGIESRMTLDVQIRADSDHGEVVLHTSALNDVVLQRPSGGHTVRAGLAVNDRPFLTYSADALLVATPTGSTAYNLSARGPVLSPRARALIVTPVAPHMLFDRSLVLDSAEWVSIRPVDGRPADVVVDGWAAPRLHPGEVLTCRQGATDARLVSFYDRDYLDILKHKFNLSER
jgi:NAD+ kinase